MDTKGEEDGYAEKDDGDDDSMSLEEQEAD